MAEPQEKFDPKKIDGKAIADTIHQELADEVKKLKSTSVIPGLAVVLVLFLKTKKKTTLWNILQNL